MGLANLKRWGCGKETSTQRLYLGLVEQEELSQEELAYFLEMMERYAKADMHTRLNLYLSHREFRQAFYALERNSHSLLP
jgi:hypothetical protein